MNPTTTAIRAAVVLCLAVLVVFNDAADHKVQQWWTEAREWSIVNHDSFEPILATSAFTLWIHVFEFIDKFVPWCHQWQFNSAGRTMSAYKHGIGYLAAAAYLAPLFLFDFVYPRRNLPEAAPGMWEIIFSLIATHFVYDLLFFPLHWAMHRVKVLRRLHNRHHTSSPLVSIDIIRHGLVDGTMQVVVNIITLNALRVHPICRALHNIVITYLLTESHAGYDCPWMLHHVVPFGILGGPRRHEYHHKTGKHNYQQFFTYFDNYIGAGVAPASFAKRAWGRGGGPLSGE